MNMMITFLFIVYNWCIRDVRGVVSLSFSINLYLEIIAKQCKFYVCTYYLAEYTSLTVMYLPLNAFSSVIFVPGIFPDIEPGL